MSVPSGNHTSAVTMIVNTTEYNDTEGHIKAWEYFFMWLIVICTIAFNIPVFIIVPKMESLMAVSSTGMLSLAVTDTCQGCLSLATLCYFYFQGHHYIPPDSVYCRAAGFLASYFASVSIITLTLLAVDKQLTIRFPLIYNQYITLLRASIVQFAIWIFCFLLLFPIPFQLFSANVIFKASAHICLPDFTLNYVHSGFILFFDQVLPTCILLQSYVALFKVAQRQNRQISDQEAQINTGASGFSKRNLRIIRTLFFMTMGYYIFWTPYFVFVNIWELISGHTLHPVLDFLFIWFGGMSSLVNPLVYIPTMKEFRIKLVHLLHLDDCFPDTNAEIPIQPSNDSRMIA